MKITVRHLLAMCNNVRSTTVIHIYHATYDMDENKFSLIDNVRIEDNKTYKDLYELELELSVKSFSWNEKNNIIHIEIY